MRVEPAGLPKHVIAEALRRHWGIEARALEYAPVGAGSHHWLVDDAAGRRWFITGDHLGFLGTQDGEPDSDFAGLEASYQTAAALRDAGLSFVVSPVSTTAGEVVRRVRPGWALAVFPFIEGHTSGFGRWADAERRRSAAGAIGQLHSVRPPARILAWDATIPHRAALAEAWLELDRPWTSGPYGERLRELLWASLEGLQALFSRYDRLAQDVVASPVPWVVTHGEPHSANFIAGSDGQVHLIDWDTVRLGPRERDLAIIVDDDRDALAAYQAIAGAFEPQPEAMEMFRLRWTLADICVDARSLRLAHDDSPDEQRNWGGLEKNLAHL